MKEREGEKPRAVCWTVSADVKSPLFCSLFFLACWLFVSLCLSVCVYGSWEISVENVTHTGIMRKQVHLLWIITTLFLSTSSTELKILKFPTIVLTLLSFPASRGHRVRTLYHLLYTPAKSVPTLFINI